MATKPAITQLSVGAKTHTGKVRMENQDRMGRFLSPFGELFIVADGMGGHQGGALAAAMVTDGFENYLRQMPPGLSAKVALQEVAQRINAEIYQGANSGDPAMAKMGSTVVLALVKSGQLLIGHAGDSRAYLVRQNRLTRLTKDHSAVQKMIDYNMLTEAEARDHPDASIINRAFGQAPEIELEISAPLLITPGDGLLLCTDGLCGYVDDSEVERVIGRCDDARKIADTLVELALNAGGEDNVTVQFLQFGQRSTAAVGRPLEAQMPLGAPPFDAGPSGDHFERHEENDGFAGLSLPMKYVLAAVLVVAIFALGTFLGSRFEWPWSGTTPTPSPTPIPNTPLSPQKSPESGGATQPGPAFEPSRTPENPGVQPTPIPKQMPASGQGNQSGGSSTLQQKGKDLLKDGQQKLEELKEQTKGVVTTPLKEKPNEQPNNQLTPPAGGQPSDKPTDGKPATGTSSDGKAADSKTTGKTSQKPAGRGRTGNKAPLKKDQADKDKRQNRNNK